jgi:hypothetical protein
VISRAATLAGATLCLACSAVASPAAAEVILSPALTARSGVTVTMPPAGLSVEYPVIAQALGSGPCPPPALVSELLQLGSPPIELGGVSQDMTMPPGALPAGPPGSWEAAISYHLPTGFWSQMHCLLSASKDPLTVGLNMRLGSLAWATQMAGEAQAAATNGLTFSLGNEPDLYDLPNYASLDKPLPGAELAAANLYLQQAAYVRPALGSAAVIGPELSTPAHWRAQLPRVIAQLHPQTVGVHMYPLSVCRNAREATLSGLLSSRAANGPARLAWVVADARSAGLPAIVSEANSVSCGGRAGVSDTPAAAVWAVRFVLSALESGFQEVRFHSSGNPYDPFLVRGAEVLVRPLGRALAALNAWLPLGATLRTVQGAPGLLTSAVAQPGGGMVLILDNESGHARSATVRSARDVRETLVTASYGGLPSKLAHPTHGRLHISVPANSVVTILPTR